MSSTHSESFVLTSHERPIVFEIPIGGTIACLMSGGADSSVMYYALASTIQKYDFKTKIFPLTAEMTQRPYNLKCAWDVIAKTKELIGFEPEHHLCYIIPSHAKDVSDDEKIVIHSHYVDFYVKQLGIEMIFNGITSNPPLSAVPEGLNSNRQKCRDDEEWIQEREKKKQLGVPFIRHDKKSIAELYDKLGIMDTIFPLTRSCEAEMDESRYFRETCFKIREPGSECWWCKERQYGFGSYDKAKDFL